MSLNKLSEINPRLNLMNTESTPPNSLIHQSSPYLLQHAYNPVHWEAWSEAAFVKAKEHNKLVVISIGYSACHWCHVMEHESFENKDVADFMNRHFISIKVDREERPDLDQIYMNAIQLLVGQGGWPLNVIATAEGKPVYACTYLPTENWLELLQKLVEINQTAPYKIEEQANAITAGVNSSIGVSLQAGSENFSRKILDEAYNEWEKHIDFEWGGSLGQPKFPMPIAISFLQDYAHFSQNTLAQSAVDISLQKMARGGIFDHVGGGFARYSVDKYWFAPHFEKMLYDNAQLMSLYSQAYRRNNNGFYKEVVLLTASFLNRELQDECGLYYSALDADSEGTEGKYYVWTSGELQTILEEDYPLFAEYFTVKEQGNWHNGKNILFNSVSVKEIASRFHIKAEDVIAEVYQLQKKLLKERQKRTAPSLDYKMLCSWNALASKGFVDAYKAFANEIYYEKAAGVYSAIKKNLQKQDGSLYRSYSKGKADINAFLDDYAFLIEAAIALYQVSFDNAYLNDARFWTDYCIKHFFDSESGMFYFTSDADPPLIARKHEITDNVIPSSNSVMAHNLFTLGLLFNEKEYVRLSEQMLFNVEASLKVSNEFMANWLKLYAKHIESPFEIVFTGKNALSKRADFDKQCDLYYITIGGDDLSIPHLHHKNLSDDLIYVCKNKHCFAPVQSVEDALATVYKS